MIGARVELRSQEKLEKRGPRSEHGKMHPENRELKARAKFRVANNTHRISLDEDAR